MVMDDVIQLLVEAFPILGEEVRHSQALPVCLAGVAGADALRKYLD